MLILSHLTGKFKFKGLIPSFLLYPSLHLSFSFFLSLFSSLPLFLSSFTYILSSYYVLSTLLGNKQKRQCLIIMGLHKEWEDRGQNNMKILKITTSKCHKGEIENAEKVFVCQGNLAQSQSVREDFPGKLSLDPGDK